MKKVKKEKNVKNGKGGNGEMMKKELALRFICVYLCAFGSFALPLQIRWSTAPSGKAWRCDDAYTMAMPQGFGCHFVSEFKIIQA